MHLCNWEHFKQQSFSPPGQSRRGEGCLGGFQGFPPSPPSSTGPSASPRSPRPEPWRLIPSTTSISPSCRGRWRCVWGGPRDRLTNDVTEVTIINNTISDQSSLSYLSVQDFDHVKHNYLKYDFKINVCLNAFLTVLHLWYSEPPPCWSLCST